MPDTIAQKMAEHTPPTPKWKGDLDPSTVADAPIAPRQDLSFYENLLRQSMAKREANSPNPGYSFTVDAEGVTAIKTRFNNAARRVGVGVGFGPVSTPDSDGKVSMSVVARKRKAVVPLTEEQKAARAAARLASKVAKGNGAGGARKRS